MRTDAKISMARRLRKQMTKPEIWLWGGLKSQHKTGPVFRRQHAIGPYVLDFYCVKAELAVEVDGEVHSRDEQRRKDEVRDAYFTGLGIETYRIIARDLLMSPDETIAGVIEFTLARMECLKVPLPSFAPQMPPSP
jgi:very-short-patch-repair endonuclease